MANAPRTGHILMHHPTLRRQRASARQLAQRALYSRNPRVVGHCVLLCGAGCCLWTRGFSGRRSQAVVPPAPSIPAAVGVLYYTKPSGGVSPACRSLMSCNSPPFGGTPTVVLVGVAPTVQTTSAKTSDNKLLSARWSALRAQQCLSRRTARTRTPEHAREPLDTHVNPSTCTWAGPPTHISSGPRAGHQAHVQVIGPTCRSSGPRAGCQARVQVIGPTCAFKGPRAGHRANVRLQGPACRSSGQRAPSRTRVRMGGPMRGHVDPGALAAMLPDGNCGTVVAGPSN